MKFKDADLIGAPIRLALTPRSLSNGGIGLKLRREKESGVVPMKNIRRVVGEKIGELKKRP